MLFSCTYTKSILKSANENTHFRIERSHSIAMSPDENEGAAGTPNASMQCRKTGKTTKQNRPVIVY